MMTWLTQFILTQDIKRNFGTIIDLGSGPGHFTRLLEPDKVQKSVMLDSSGMYGFFLYVNRIYNLE